MKPLHSRLHRQPRTPVLSSANHPPASRHQRFAEKPEKNDSEYVKYQKLHITGQQAAHSNCTCVTFIFASVAPVFSQKTGNVIQYKYSLFKNEKERERGSNLRRQHLASPTAQVLVAQTTQPVQKIRLRDELECEQQKNSSLSSTSTNIQQQQ